MSTARNFNSRKVVHGVDNVAYIVPVIEAPDGERVDTFQMFRIVDMRCPAVYSDEMIERFSRLCKKHLVSVRVLHSTVKYRPIVGTSRARITLYDIDTKKQFYFTMRGPNSGAEDNV